ncbi:uncharacterized protein N7506_008629 [Penicillium brevicompactum]|uniref:uncharacterized protein n=1 Tax=Penicillium brevicompactum TaxID=5074 RepID=UPI00253FCC41|nr:uncharacterized protein N7506_008629 [Penicillium brevicompactum]KAJ5325527.1 hypothetical protein N7506_008629 [Penicillium brevicompactum]
MLSHRKSSQKLPDQLIGRFQQLYGKSKLEMQSDITQQNPAIKRRNMATPSERQAAVSPIESAQAYPF